MFLICFEGVLAAKWFIFIDTKPWKPKKLQNRSPQPKTQNPWIPPFKNLTRILEKQKKKTCPTIFFRPPSIIQPRTRGGNTGSQWPFLKCWQEWRRLWLWIVRRVRRTFFFLILWLWGQNLKLPFGVDTGPLVILLKCCWDVHYRGLTHCHLFSGTLEQNATSSS